MKIDLKWIIGFIGTALFGLCTWVLVSVVELKEDTQFIQCFVCPNFQSRVMGQVFCKGDPLK